MQIREKAEDSFGMMYVALCGETVPPLIKLFVLVGDVFQAMPHCSAKRTTR